MTPARRAERRVIRAAVGKQWESLADWIEQGRPFIPIAQATIVRDIRALAKAVAAYRRKK